jgi:DNA-binding transcriptional regulator GbsR (MarR family)
MNIRYLEQWEAVKKIWVKGSRKDYYEARTDLPKIVLKRLREGLGRRMGDFMRHIEHIESELKKSDGAMYDNYRKKFEKIKEFNNLVNKALSIGETFLK